MVKKLDNDYDNDHQKNLLVITNSKYSQDILACVFLEMCPVT